MEMDLRVVETDMDFNIGFSRIGMGHFMDLA
jgi:hypothetical protein